jgi:hypothetical protein
LVHAARQIAAAPLHGWHPTCTSSRAQEDTMREHSVTLPELALIGATRGMIGFGVGLLISERLGSDHRKAVGLTLLIAGALSTIPLAIRLFRGAQSTRDGVAPGRGHDVDERMRARAAATMVE